MTGLAILIRSFPHTKYPDEVDVAIQVATGEQPLKTRQVITLRDVERDYLDTLVTETVSTYMYGETVQDVCRAAVTVKKQARAHAMSHSL